MRYRFCGDWLFWVTIHKHICSALFMETASSAIKAISFVFMYSCSSIFFSVLNICFIPIGIKTSTHFGSRRTIRSDEDASLCWLPLSTKCESLNHLFDTTQQTLSVGRKHQVCSCVWICAAKVTGSNILTNIRATTCEGEKTRHAPKQQNTTDRRQEVTVSESAIALALPISHPNWKVEWVKFCHLLARY